MAAGPGPGPMVLAASHGPAAAQHECIAGRKPCWTRCRCNSGPAQHRCTRLATQHLHSARCSTQPSATWPPAESGECVTYALHPCAPLGTAAAPHLALALGGDAAATARGGVLLHQAHGLQLLQRVADHAARGLQGEDGTAAAAGRRAQRPDRRRAGRSPATPGSERKQPCRRRGGSSMHRCGPQGLHMRRAVLRAP